MFLHLSVILFTVEVSTTHPLAKCMLGYGQQADSTHPTGMHSRSGVKLRTIYEIKGVSYTDSLTHTKKTLWETNSCQSLCFKVHLLIIKVSRKRVLYFPYPVSKMALTSEKHSSIIYLFPSQRNYCLGSIFLSSIYNDLLLQTN